MLEKVWVNSGLSIFSANTLLLAGWSGLYSDLTLSINKINSFEVITDS